MITMFFYNHDGVQYIFIFIFFFSYDQFIIQYPLLMLNEWHGYCV